MGLLVVIWGLVVDGFLGEVLSQDHMGVSGGSSIRLRTRSCGL